MLSEEYKKPRKLFEMFRLIKTRQAVTPEELARIFNTSAKTIHHYKEELNQEWGTQIDYNKSKNQYEINRDGMLGFLKISNPITADDVMLILASLSKSQTFMETKMNIIKNSLLALLPDEEAEKLKSMLYFEKTINLNEQNIEFNIPILRRAIAEEKKIYFTYRSAANTFKTHKIIPYSFACEIGKYYIIGKLEDKEKLVHYRLDRMREVKILQEDGKRSDKFNVYEYLKKTWYMYGGNETEIVVKFKNSCYSVVTEKDMIEGELLQKDKDFFTYKFVANGTMGIKLWLMGFGPDAEILSPVELRQEIKNYVSEMANIYRLIWWFLLRGKAIFPLFYYYLFINNITFWGNIYLEVGKKMDYQNMNKEELIQILRKKDDSIEELYLKMKKLSYYATIDGTTGTLNKRSGLELLNKEINLSKVYDKNLVVCFVDVDRLKTINDNFGHEEGDKLLVSVGKILKESIRKDDFVIRMGGDEFLIVFPETTMREADKVWCRICKLVEETNKSRHKYSLSLSHGFCEYNIESKISIEELIKNADMEMYREKNKKKWRS